jgi:hypothetical protein
MMGNDMDPIRKSPPYAQSETYIASPTNPNALTMSNPFPSSQLSTSVFGYPSISPDFRDAYI